MDEAADTQEEALRAREALLLLESVTDHAIFRLDPAGVVVSWNVGAERIKGYRASEIVGQHFARFYTPEDVREGKCEQALAVAAREGRYEAEGWRVRKDGSRFWASVVITAIRSADGLLGYAKVTRDLTERRDAEEQRIRHAQTEAANRLKDELLQSEREARHAAEEAQSSLMTMLQSIGDAVIATDVDGNVTLMNPVAERLTGWTLQDARQHPLPAVFHIINEGTRRVVESPVHRVLREGIVVGLANHTVLISRDGTESPIQDSGAPIRDGEGNIRGMVLVFRDASEEARANARREFLAEATGILSSSLDYKDTLSRVAELVIPRLADWCSIDILEDGRPVQVGVAHVDPLKLDLARDLTRRYPPELHPLRGVLNVLRTGRSELHSTITDEMLVEHAQDEPHLRMLRALGPRSMIIVPLYGGSGARALGTATLIFTNSTRRYTAGDLAFAEQLALRAASAIENARLYASEQRARDLADAASRSKDEFLASVSHELRTPLSAILGWARMLAMPSMDDRRRARAVETIDRNAQAMARLIEDLLDVSRIVSGKMRLDLAAVPLAPLIEDAIESSLPAATARSVHIERQLDADAGAVHVDAERIQQVVRNLLNNAVKFTPAGGRVTVALARREAGVTITVSDTGKGIEPRFLAHVFEPFRQEDSRVARAAGGLGLGLAIVREIVELHGGTVTAYSAGLGCGATFTVRLPARGQRARPRSSEPGGSPSLASLPQLDGLRVLVVDDEPDMRDLLREILAEAGSQVTTAASVAEAMGAFERGEVPDVLVSDISMPDETGYDLIRRVRALPEGRGGKVPAAALTALARAEDRRDALNAGFELHVPKPVEPAALVTVVAMLARFAGR